MIQWSDQNITSLGICALTDEIMNQNYSSTVSKMHNILKVWKMRDLTLMGKVTVINALISSLFVYKMQVLPNMSEDYRRSIACALSDFIWRGKRPKIRTEVLQGRKNEGGLRLVDLK